jgi:hypothetical protein
MAVPREVVVGCSSKDRVCNGLLVKPAVVQGDKNTLGRIAVPLFHETPEPALVGYQVRFVCCFGQWKTLSAGPSGGAPGDLYEAMNEE